MGAAQLEPLEQLAALRVGQREQRVPVQVEDVEEHVGDGDVAHGAAHRGLVGQVHARLQALEARPALGVEGDDLAVEDRPSRAPSARPSSRSSG